MTRRVLIVEDDPHLTRWFRMMESDTVQIETVVPPLPLNTFDFSQYDLIVLDINLPGPFSGIQIAAVLRADYPDTEIALITGYPPDYIASMGALPPNVNVLHKPMDADQLIELVEGTRGT